MDSSSLYYYIFDVPDPEFPNSTLEDLGIVRPEGVTVDCCGYARVEIKPTVEYCSYVPMIALAIHERLLDEVPEEYKRLRLSLEIVDHRESDMCK
ncbi:putative COG5133 domain protein [Gregarina niphandrodes]|uniref:COG5133 domain protein n=1 Tax=Gregarina niphandrodes TaxID=110365 RepID=A0A023B9A7_GRENI|nr:putative COG5133 domain protein [Gregarina niphandrodes]EZG72382.1 putative COG5133 domain protein [Gregarina niphandrodes]|eukprot:XP_011129780.1 putative COG5133 domain protein [Gregarina niphandrodes]